MRIRILPELVALLSTKNRFRTQSGPNKRFSRQLSLRPLRILSDITPWTHSLFFDRTQVQMNTRNPELSGGKQSEFNAYPFFVARCWHAMSMGRLFELLKEGRYQFDRYPMIAGAMFTSSINSVCDRIQSALHWDRAVATERQRDPLFVVGHWRTGTTFLQYLLGLDERMRTPDTFECMLPEQFIVTRWLFSKIMFCPSRRPMDNITMGWGKPQEDEFAFCNQGATSVYRHFAFPNEPNLHSNSLTMDNVSSATLAHWKQTLHRFVTYLNYQHQKPLIFKSPTHTGRIQVLLDMYPNAKFIHITRDPYDFIPSTMYLWKSLDATTGMQRDVSHLDHEDYVFDCFHRMYGSFEKRRHLIPDENIVEVTYDQITSKTVKTLGHVYQSLQLGNFFDVKPAIDQHLEAKRNYKRNEHQLSPRLKDRIETECGDYIAKYCGNRFDGSRKAAA